MLLEETVGNSREVEGGGGGVHINFDKAPLIADSTLKPTFCVSLSHTVQAPDPAPERGGPGDAQDRADQLHVPPADPHRGL